MSEENSLKQLLQNSKNRTYAEYVSGEFGIEKEQIEIGRTLEGQVLEQFEAYIRDKGYTLGSVSEERLKWAREQLYSGRVAGVDGRRDKPIDIISGVFCEVGIATVTYLKVTGQSIRNVLQARQHAIISNIEAKTKMPHLALC